MGLDVVSPLSMCVFASLAIACTVRLTVNMVPSGPVVRAVLDVCTVRAPTILVNLCSTFLSSMSLDVASGSLSALRATPLFAVWGIPIFLALVFFIVSLCLLSSFEAPLNDNDLRLITTFSITLKRAFKTINARLRQVYESLPLVAIAALAVCIFWPTSALRAYCHDVPLSRRTAYLNGSLAGIRCDEKSFHDFYRRLAGLLLVSLLRFSSLLVATALVIVFAVYVLLFVYAIWKAYFARNASAFPLAGSSSSTSAIMAVGTSSLTCRVVEQLVAIFADTGVDLMLATLPRWLTWTTLARCVISFAIVSFWISLSIKSLDDKHLRFVNILNTTVLRLVKALNAYRYRLGRDLALACSVLLAVPVFWPTSALCAYCYSVPLSQRVAYLEGSAAGIRCDSKSFHELYRRLARLALTSAPHVLARAAVTLIAGLAAAYLCLFLHAIWIAYFDCTATSEVPHVYVEVSPSTYWPEITDGSSTENLSFYPNSSDTLDDSACRTPHVYMQVASSTVYYQSEIIVDPEPLAESLASYENSPEDPDDSSSSFDPESQSSPRADTHSAPSTSLDDSSVFFDAESGSLIEANTLCSRFPDDYYIHPDFIAKYELGSLLGAGGNGFVLQARRRSDGQQVAVKFALKGDRAARWPVHPIYGRVTRDVICVDLLQHKNIIALLDVFSDDKYLYIVQELYGTLSYPMGSRGRRNWPNGSRCLASYLATLGPMPLDVATYIFHQLADAVAYLWSKGITHCDIKPENILIDAATLQIKLIDFGNSMQMPDEYIGVDHRGLRDPNPERFRGTTLYTPPEILSNEVYEPCVTDVWAMGVVLCEMIIGERPFSTREEVLAARPYPGWGDAVRQALLPVWYIVGSCLHFDFALRPTAAELLLGDDYFAVMLEREKYFGVEIGAHWADGIVV